MDYNERQKLKALEKLGLSTTTSIDGITAVLRALLYQAHNERNVKDWNFVVRTANRFGIDLTKDYDNIRNSGFIIDNYRETLIKAGDRKETIFTVLNSYCGKSIEELSMLEDEDLLYIAQTVLKIPDLPAKHYNVIMKDLKRLGIDVPEEEENKKLK